MKIVFGTLMILTFVGACAQKSIKPEVIQASQPAPTTAQVVVVNPDLKMVHFAVNQSLLSENARTVLDQNVTALKEDIQLKFQIQGFCDDRGTVKYNIALGVRRAEAVKNYLEGQGIASDRITISSFGKSEPLNSNENEAAYALNRRASFLIVKMGDSASL